MSKFPTCSGHSLTYASSSGSRVFNVLRVLQWRWASLANVRVTSKTSWLVQDAWSFQSHRRIVVERWLWIDLVSCTQLRTALSMFKLCRKCFFFIYAARGADASLEKGSLKTDVFLVQLSNPWTKAFPKQLYPLLKCY